VAAWTGEAEGMARGLAIPCFQPAIEPGKTS
jgi:hypothetical protein